MTEFFKEVISIYKEKTKLPIVSTYVILLIVWNWDILSIYLFASVNMETRVCWIKNLVPGIWDHVCRILFPAAISFTYPFITNKLMYYTDKWLDNSITKRTEILNKRRINTAEARFKIKEAELGTSDLKQLEAQISELEGKRDSLTSSLESANKQNEDLNNRLKSSVSVFETQKNEIDLLRNVSYELNQIKEYLPNYKELINQNKELLDDEKFRNNHTEVISRFENYYEDLSDMNFKFDKLKEIALNLNKFMPNQLSSNSQIFTYLLENGIVRPDEVVGNSKTYALTSEANDFINYLKSIGV